MDLATTPRMTDETGVRFGIATAAEILALLVTGAAGLGVTLTGVVLVAVTALAGRTLRLSLVVLLGVVAWAFFTGFVENSFGLLTFAHADMLRLAVIATAVPALARLAQRPGEAGRADGPAHW